MNRLFHPFVWWRTRKAAVANARARTLTPDELTRAHWTDRRSFRWIGFGLALMLAAGLINAVTVDREQTAGEKRDESLVAQGEKLKGFLVATCAIPNVNRIFVTNAFKRLEDLGISTQATKAEVAEAFQQTYAELQPVDCKAFLTPDERLQVCLNYPTTIADDPKATTTTEFQPACNPEGKN